jgi:hypothetical protein
MNHQEFLVTLNVPFSLEDAMVDCLLTFEFEQGFSSLPVYAHDAHRNENLSLVEQVTGRHRKIRFQMYVEKQNLALLLNKLRTEFEGAGLHYWVMPVLEHGAI